MRGPRVSPESPASRIVGPNPRGAIGRVSLAVRRALRGCPAGGSALVALSGGADSLALALAVIDAGTRAGLQVVTVTVDHALRPESAREAARAAEMAERLGARARVVRVEVGDEGGPEGAARSARLAALAQCARAEAAPVLLGHTMDDQAETVLLRLARGSGASSLRAMSPDIADEGGVRWIRPLLGVRRADTRGACAQAGLTWIEDPSNEPEGPWRAEDGSPLRRAAVRAHAIPMLAEALKTDPIPALARSAELASRDDEALELWASREWGRARRTVRVHDGDAPALSLHALEGLPRAVRSRIERRFVLEAGARPSALSSIHIDALDALVTDWHGQGPLDLPGVMVKRMRDPRGLPVLVTVRP